MGTEMGGTRPPGGHDAPVLWIVDDDDGTLALVRDLAEERGWTAYGFRRLADVVQVLAAQRPTLLVLDDDLPDGRGGDLARELRGDPALGDVSLLVCTAAHPMRRREIGGWASVISKPFDLHEFERHLDASAPSMARPQPQPQPAAG